MDAQSSERRHYAQEVPEIRASLLQLVLKLEEGTDAVCFGRPSIYEVVDAYVKGCRLLADASVILRKNVLADLVPVYQGSFLVTDCDLAEEAKANALVAAQEALYVGLVPPYR